MSVWISWKVLRRPRSRICLDGSGGGCGGGRRDQSRSSAKREEGESLRDEEEEEEEVFLETWKSDDGLWVNITM